MELLSKNFERWANDVSMEMPQLINREMASGSSMAQFSRIHEDIISSQYRPQSENVNFSEEEEKEEVKDAIEEAVEEEATKEAVAELASEGSEGSAEVSASPEMEAEFVKNLQDGKYVAELERAVASRPMNVFGNGAGLKGAIDTTGTDPEAFVVVENTPVSEKTEIAGPREVAPMVPGMAVAGLDNEPVLAPEEALPEAKAQPTEAAMPVYPEQQIVDQDTVVEDPVSLEGVEMTEQLFDQEEAKHMEEVELYKQFMNSVM